VSVVGDAASGGSFRIETSAGEGSPTIKVVGELDSGNCDELVDAFEVATGLREGDAPLSLDMRDVSFIDSSGMRSMIQIERAADTRGIPLVLMPPPDEVTDLLRMAGITERMQLASGGEAAGLGSDFLDRVELQLDREPMAPSLARAEVREALASRLEDADLATVVLLTSELVTNAVIHPKVQNGSTLTLEIRVHESGVRVEVEDPGEGFDPATPASSSSHGGRGLFLVDRCSMSWGAKRTEDHRGRRFRVWFEFTSGAPEAAAATG